MFETIKHFFKKWKVVDTDKYRVVNRFEYNVIPRTSTYFLLSEKQQKQVNELYKEKGSMDYSFYYTGIGIGFKVKIWTTGEVIDLTDYDTW